MSFVGVVLLLISSGVIIIVVAAGLVFSPVVLPIHRRHMRGQPPIMILELSNHLMQSFYSWKVRDVVRFIPVVLLMFVVMLITSIMWMMLIITNITNIINHIRTLAPYGTIQSLRGGCSRPYSGCQCVDLFSRVSDDVSTRFELFVCSSGGRPARDSDTRFKTLFYSSRSKKDQLLTCDSP